MTNNNSNIKINYLRHEKILELPGWGESALTHFTNSHIVIIGMGGLGSAVLPLLVGAGVGKITICDDDKVELSNLHRQTIYQKSDINEPKVIAASKFALARNDEVQIIPVNEACDLANIEKIIAPADLIIDCTDNFRARYMLNDACYFKKKKLLSASATYTGGSLQYFDFSCDNTACMRCLYPNDPSESSAPSCADTGVLGPVVSIIGSLASVEALKVIANKGSTLKNQTFIYDGLNAKTQKMGYLKNDACRLCGEEPEIQNLTDSAYQSTWRQCAH